MHFQKWKNFFWMNKLGCKLQRDKKVIGKTSSPCQIWPVSKVNFCSNDLTRHRFRLAIAIQREFGMYNFSFANTGTFSLSNQSLRFCSHSLRCFQCQINKNWTLWKRKTSDLTNGNVLFRFPSNLVHISSSGSYMYMCSSPLTFELVIEPLQNPSNTLNVNSAQLLLWLRKCEAVTVAWRV